MNRWFAHFLNRAICKYKPRTKLTRHQLGVELLEGRITPSTYTVLNLANSGAGSFRQAITDSNNNPGADNIVFANGLTGTIVITSDLPTITGDTTITGPGSANLTINANNGANVFSIIVVSNSNSLTFTNVSITGMTFSGLRSGVSGAFQNFENLTLSDVNITNNASDALTHSFGTLIYNTGTISGNTSFPVTLTSTATLTNLTVTGNTFATSNGIISTSSNVTFIDSSISGNTGVGINAQSGGTVTLIRSTISNNSMRGITTFTPLILQDSQVTNNQGGGLSVNGITNIMNSTVSNNSTTDRGAGIFAGNSAQLTISNSTISNNTAANAGGGIYLLNSAPANLSNVTIANNTANNINTSNGAGGGGIYVGSGALKAINTIISNNTSSVDADIHGTISTGSNNLVGNGSVNLQALNNNGGPTQTRALGAGSSALDAGTLLTTVNAAATDADTTLTVVSSTFLQAGQLYRIGNEIVKVVTVPGGGTTVTVLRGQEGTTAAAMSVGNGIQLAYDQRGAGYVRVFGAAVDIGAYEVSATAPTISSLAPTFGTVTGGSTVTITGSGFTGATSVKFGATNAASYVVNSDTQITATTPAGSGVVNISVTTPGGTSANTAADDFTYVTKLTNVVIGDGTGQRSTIRKITLSFNGNIDIGGVGAGSISITNQSDVVIPGLNINVAGAGTNTLVLTFSDTNPNDSVNNFNPPNYGTPASTGPVTFGSLVDGLYRLKLNGATLLSGGVAVDIDANGTAGGTRNDDFHRLFGDKDGDQTVGTFDYFPSLINAINKELGEPGYDAAWDYDNDDVIGTFDFFPHLVNRFNAEIF